MKSGMFLRETYHRVVKKNTIFSSHELVEFMYQNYGFPLHGLTFSSIPKKKHAVILDGVPLPIDVVPTIPSGDYFLEVYFVLDGQK